MNLLPILPSRPGLMSGIFIADMFHTIAKASSIIFEISKNCWCKNFWIRKAESADSISVEQVEKEEYCNDTFNKQPESQYLEETAPGIESTNNSILLAVAINHNNLSSEDIPLQTSRGYAEITFPRKAWHKCHFHFTQINTNLWAFFYQ